MTTEALADGRARVVVAGEVDLFSAPRLKTALEDALDDGSAGLVVDLSAVTELDSSGLAALVSVSKRARRIGGEIAVVVNPEIMRRFRITGLDGLFPVADR